ncbi:MAG: lytic transglycosylase domain-containing protein [Alphaproteobacteria bacterium]|nr:lytic transglycosylase domain-containing protein [Alphaproteobacteria bacterium]
MSRLKRYFTGIGKASMLYALCFMLFVCGFAANASQLPNILSDHDADVYSRIFKLQAQERIADAARLYKEIQDPLLMSDVLHQKYMSRTYRTPAAELAEWMRLYWNMPGAPAIHALAKRRGAATRAPVVPVSVALTGDHIAQSENWTTQRYTGETARQINQFRSFLRRGHTRNARAILEDRSFKRRVNTEDYGRLAGRLAFIYYSGGHFELAREWGMIAAESKSEFGLWTMGLVSFKQGDFDDAHNYFALLSEVGHINETRRGEAAFWAGRAAAANGDNRTARKFWRIAARRPQTFYGALAAAMLGEVPRYEFFESNWSREDIAELMRTAYGMRALALLQIGENARAEGHLRFLIADSSNNRLLHAVHAVAEAASLGRTSMQVSVMIRNRGIVELDDNVISAAQYPMPGWEPLGGWSIDRALLFAVMRQESGFKPTAKSRVGAKGVMQIMPGTARMVARQNNMRMADIDMSHPEYNMFLGQQHIVELLALPNKNNCIIRMLVAYNTGPVAKNRWERRFQTDDPLLYIESFPFAETRGYIKRVLSNLWIYRARLGQPLTNISELADGKWPKYGSYDQYVITLPRSIQRI